MSDNSTNRAVILLSAILLPFLLTRCEDRALQYGEALLFNLEVSSAYSGNKVFVGQGIPIDLVLSYERQPADNEFYVSTDMLRRGELLREGAVITHWTIKRIGKSSLIFEPLEAGKHILYFNVLDKYGQEQQENLEFYVENPPFHFALSEVEKTLYKGQSASLVMELQNPEGATVGPYQYKYAGDLEGTLYVDGSPVEKAGEYHSIEVGTHVVKYTPDFSREGVQTLTFVAKDNFGREVEQTLAIEVIKNEIEVALRMDKPLLQPDQTAAISLHATPSYDLGKTYELRIESDREVDLISGQQSVPLGETLNNQDLQEKQYECKPRKDGEKGSYVLTATYTDRFGDSYSDALSIGVGSTVLQFKFSLSGPDEVYCNESASLRLRISPITKDIDYRFRIYATDENVQFSYQGQALSRDAFYPLENESSPVVIAFSSSTLGTHTVFVEVKNGADKSSKIQKEIVVKERAPIRVSLTPDKSEVLSGQSNTLTLTVTPAPDLNRCDIAYEFLLGKGEIDTGQEPVVTGDSFTKAVRVTPASGFSGELTLRATVSEKGNLQNAVTAEARFAVRAPNFKYAATLLDPSIYLGDKARIGLKISEKGGVLPKNTRFTFDSDRKGKLLYDGKSYAQDVSIDLGDKTDFEVQFVPEEAGTVNLTLSFTDAFNRTHPVEVSPIEVRYPTFELKLSRYRGDDLLDTGDTPPIWIEIIPPQDDPVDRTYNWSYEVSQKSDRIAGIEPGTPTEIKGRSEMRYVYRPSNARGIHRLTVTAVDQYGKEKTETLTFDVKRRFKIESATAFYREEGPIRKTTSKFPMSFWAKIVLKAGETLPRKVMFFIYCGDNEGHFLGYMSALDDDLNDLLRNPNKEIHLKKGSQGYFTESELRSDKDIKGCMDSAGEFNNLTLLIETEDKDKYVSELEVPIQKER